jgi:hypothetical protein
MHLPEFYKAFNTRVAVRQSRLLPVRTDTNSYPLTCGNCKFINKASNNFCTNCGYPIHPTKDRLALYNIRLQRRKNLLNNCMIKISQARNALYILAGLFTFGIFYLFSDWRETVIKGLVMVVLAVIYAGLGRWSLQKPFTSLLISLIIMLTFAAINTYAEFFSKTSSSGGLYMIVLQGVLIYFLLQGVKGAFHADILEEEFKL